VLEGLCIVALRELVRDVLMKRYVVYYAIVALWVAPLVRPLASVAGPYSLAGGQAGSTAVSATSSSIVEWAAGATIVRGLRNIENPTEYGSAGSPQNYAFYGGSDGASVAAGASSTANSAPIGAPPQPQTAYYGVALGQNGSATITFTQPITNGPGYDFAVFSNGFSSGPSLEWAKPALVSVSSDGVHFFQFPSVSLTQTTTQLGGYGEVDPTNLYDLAGKDPAGWGTPFDLNELVGASSLLNVNDIIAVRVTSCTGDINPAYATYDSQGDIINSPWPGTSVAGSEGFNLAGVGVMNELSVPEPVAGAILAVGSGLLLLRNRRRRLAA